MTDEAEAPALRARVHLLKRHVEERDELVKGLQDTVMRVTDQLSDSKQQQEALRKINKDLAERLEVTSLSLTTAVQEKDELTRKLRAVEENESLKRPVTKAAESKSNNVEDEKKEQDPSQREVELEREVARLRAEVERLNGQLQAVSARCSM